MTDNAIPKAIIIAGAMISWSIATSHFGFSGFVFMMMGIGAGGYLAWREFWETDIQSSDNINDDVVADRFR